MHACIHMYIHPGSNTITLTWSKEIHFAIHYIFMNIIYTVEKMCIHVHVWHMESLKYTKFKVTQNLNTVVAPIEQTFFFYIFIEIIGWLD